MKLALIWALVCLPCGNLANPPGWADYNRHSKFHRMAKKLSPEEIESATPTYEAALAELERLVAAMEAGQLPLDELLTSYRRGAELLALCRERLTAVEQQVKVLEDGRLKPWAAA